METLHKYADYGRPLTVSEVDANWTFIQDVLSSIDDGFLRLYAIGPSEDGSGIVFYAQDMSVIGEVPIPSPLIPAGPWAASVSYSGRSVVTHMGGVYWCVEPHVSTADFDADKLAGKWTTLIAPGAATDATEVTFDAEGMDAETVHDAILETMTKASQAHGLATGADERLDLLEPVVAGFTTPPAEDVTYDNTASGLEAEDLQAAIDELAAGMGGGGGGPASDAEDVAYDNTVSGLAATDVQAAIDELAAASVGGERHQVVTVNLSSGNVTLLQEQWEAAALIVADVSGSSAGSRTLTLPTTALGIRKMKMVSATNDITSLIVSSHLRGSVSLMPGPGDKILDMLASDTAILNVSPGAVA